MKFITLTGIDDSKIVVNLTNVFTFYEDSDGTHVDFTDSYFIRVKESVEDIQSMVLNDQFQAALGITNERHGEALKRLAEGNPSD